MHPSSAVIHPPSQGIDSGGIIVNHGSINALLSRNVCPAKPHLVAALGTRATPAWVKARLWNSFRVSSRMKTMILVDTGASGGNYASSAFMAPVEEISHGGKSIKKSTGKGCTYGQRTPTPSKFNQSMSVIGSCTVPLVFPPMDRVHEATA